MMNMDAVVNKLVSARMNERANLSHRHELTLLSGSARNSRKTGRARAAPSRDNPDGDSRLRQLPAPRASGGLAPSQSEVRRGAEAGEFAAHPHPRTHHLFRGGGAGVVRIRRSGKHPRREARNTLTRPPMSHLDDSVFARVGLAGDDNERALRNPATSTVPLPSPCRRGFP